MKRSTKIWLIVATSLILLGSIIFTGALAMSNFDFSRLSTAKYETNTYDITEDITSISIDTDTADIVFIASDDKASVECYEKKSEKHSVTVENGKLTVKRESTKKWYQYIEFFNFSSPKITVNLPTGEYGDIYITGSTGKVSISNGFTFGNVFIKRSTGNVSLLSEGAGDVTVKCSTGSITAKGVNARSLSLITSTGHITASDITCEGNMNVKVSTGKTTLSNVSCNDLATEGDTGNITLNGVIAAGRIDIERSTGDVRFEGCDAAELHVETDTGNVRGSLLTDKIFFTETDTGKVNIPKSTSGGVCEIETDTGDIIITVE